MKRKTVLLSVIISCMLVSAASGQSGREFRRSAVHNGNLIRTVFSNWGVIGQPRDQGPRGAWIHPNNGYIGDVSPIIGAEVKWLNPDNGDTTVFHSVVVCPVERPTNRREESPEGIPWGFEPVSGFFNETQESIAISTNPGSWPPFWPDKMTDSEDPGWQGAWNGYFGKNVFNADQESYFVMDDNGDIEFNDPNNNASNIGFRPDPNDATRNGLGIEVKVRGMQWQQFLAADCIFWLYEVTNKSTTDYDRVVFAMLVGTYVGVTGTDDSPQEYDDDFSFFDVEKDLTYTADFPDNNSRNPSWVGDVGVVGYAFLESPGNPFDGIDNDGDADDNPLFPATGPLFTEEDFEPVVFYANEEIVIIDNEYKRTVVTVESQPKNYTTRGKIIYLVPGETELAEGNIIKDSQGQDIVNPNAYDGIDNDLDGLIDENFYLHYRQVRKDTEGNTLIDKLNPVRYKDYRNGLGVYDLLIDERRNDGIDNDGDWNEEFDDVGADGKAGTGDIGEGDGFPTPGEPNLDHVDVDESDQIGLTSFEYFTPAGDVTLGDDEDMWNRLRPGFFEVPKSIVNNRPTQGEDGDFTYGSGYFPLRAGETERFSLALIYGEGGGKQMDLTDLLKNRKTVQKIYNSDYRFPQPPEKPTLRAVPGDGQVTLYWDRKSEYSVDPVLKIKDFEGYKIYRSSDFAFDDVRSITNADGIVEGYIPLAQFDVSNGVKGYFQARGDLYQDARGYSFNLGNDTGLRHSFVDTDVKNGQTYYYALVAYDKGDENSDIFPSENTKFISILSTGEVVTDVNTVQVVPNAETAGYVPPPSGIKIEGSGDASGEIYYEVVAKDEVTGNSYEIQFVDTRNDGIDNDGDWDPAADDIGSDGNPDVIDEDGTQNNGLPDPGEPNLDQNDDDEYMVPMTSGYTVKKLEPVTESFIPNDTISVELKNQNLIEGTVSVVDEDGHSINPANYQIDYADGKIRSVTYGGLLGQFYTITYEYYPVYRSPYIYGSPFESESFDADVFDGVRLSFNNNWLIDQIDSLSGWNVDLGLSYTMAPIETQLDPYTILRGFRHPGDYRIIFYNEIVDTSASMYGALAIPTDFRVYNATDKVFVDFIYVEIDSDNKLSPKDELIFIEKNGRGEDVFTWDIYFYSRKDTIFTFEAGDTLKVSYRKPFRKGDLYSLTTTKPEISDDMARSGLERIKVVPNPYVAATAHENPLPPNITSGRGVRKIDFIHLPAEAKIHIFTSRGGHVITLQHDGNIEDGTVSWNLKTKENLDVAYGIYFYVVESKFGKKSGKLAIIK